ncbi:(2Fe-2S)-binding protein, partial [Burkholderia multivorans]
MSTDRPLSPSSAQGGACSSAAPCQPGATPPVHDTPSSAERRRFLQSAA